MPQPKKESDELLPTLAVNAAAASIGANPETEDAARDFAARLKSGTLQPENSAEADALAILEQSQKQVDAHRAQLLREELGLREQHQREFQRALAEKRPLPPIRTRLRAHQIDQSVPIDKDGKLIAEKGKVYRLVRLTDGEGRTNYQRANQLAQWGYKPVESKVDGAPVTQWTSMWMEAPAEAEGERKAYHEKDLVTADKKQRTQWEHAVESANRGFGQEAFRPFAAEEHGHRGRAAVPVFPDER